MIDMMAVAAGFIIELPIFLALAALLRKKHPDDKPVPKEAKSLAWVLAVILAALFFVDVISGAPLTYMIIFLVLGLIVCAGTARRPIIAGFLLIAWLFASYGFFMAVRWEWSFDDGYRTVHNRPALMDVSISVYGGRLFHSVLFPAFDGIAFRPPYELSVLLLVPDSPKGTPYRVFNLQFKEDRGQARTLKIESEKGPIEELRGTIGQEGLPTDINFDPKIHFRSKIDSRASFFLFEFDVALDLPGGAQTQHVEISVFRGTKTTLTWEPFDL